MDTCFYVDIFNTSLNEEESAAAVGPADIPGLFYTGIVELDSSVWHDGSMEISEDGMTAVLQLPYLIGVGDPDHAKLSLVNTCPDCIEKEWSCGHAEWSVAPTLIKDREGLEKINYDLGGSYLLTCDIDLDEAETDETSELSDIGEASDAAVPFAGIGSAERAFTGTLDGGGYKISGSISCYEPQSVPSSGSCFGLVIINSGTIRLLVVDADVDGQYSSGTYMSYYNKVGGIVGENRGRIEECCFTGTVYGGICTGGIAGQNLSSMGADTCVITDCMNAGMVICTQGAGICCASRDENVIRCIDLGDVLSDDGSAGYSLGAIIESGGTGTDCYFDFERVKLDNPYPDTTNGLTTYDLTGEIPFEDGSAWELKRPADGLAYYPYPGSIGERHAISVFYDGKSAAFVITVIPDEDTGESEETDEPDPVEPVDITPQNVKASAGDGQATITWDAVSGATRYAVYSYLDGQYTLLDSNVKATNYTATYLTNGTKYGFKVKAYVGKWSAASKIAYTTPTTSTVPQGVKAVAGNGEVTVKWNEVAGAEKYAVYIYIDGKYTCITSEVTDLSYVVTELKNGTKYGFKVKACVDGKWSAASLISYATPTE